jgi:ABC-type Zn uptake system ZnuABC Zn-binding protein ZnuA
MRLLITVLILVLFANQTFAIEKITVAVSLPPIQSITKELIKETSIELINPFGADATIDEYENILRDRENSLDSLSKSVSAVISVRSFLPSDNLFLHLRERNIKVVEIDCATPYNPNITALGKLYNGDELNPYFWISLSNSIRVAETIASDLSKLSIEDSAKVLENLKLFKSKTITLKNEYETKFLELENFEVASINSSYDYFLQDINLFVTQTFPPEFDWSESDYQRFKGSIKNGEIVAVVNGWKPFGEIGEIADAASIKFIELKTGVPAGSNFKSGYIEFLKTNLESVFTGLLSN